MLEGNRELAGELAAAFDGATEAIRAFQEELGALPGFTGITEESFSAFGSMGLDTEQAKKQLDSFIALAKKPIQLSANASGIVSAGRSAYENLRSLFSSPLTISVRTVHESDDSPESSWLGGEGSASTVRYQMSTGGRFTKPTDVQVAEDGDAEYIIPVKKEERAVPLVRQMLAELSPEARESVVNSEFIIQNSELCDIDPGGEIGNIAGAADSGVILNGVKDLFSAPSAGSLGTTNISQDNRTVSAPMNIQVHASGTNAEQIGESVYNTAERYLLRTLRSVMA